MSHKTKTLEEELAELLLLPAHNAQRSARLAQLAKLPTTTNAHMLVTFEMNLSAESASNDDGGAESDAALWCAFISACQWNEHVVEDLIVNVLPRATYLIPPCRRFCEINFPAAVPQQVSQSLD